MKTILTIGYTHFLFPDEGKAAKALALLAGALPCKHDLEEIGGQYKDTFTVESDVRLKMECVGKDTVIRGEKPKADHGRKIRPALPAPRLLKLED